MNRGGVLLMPYVGTYPEEAEQGLAGFEAYGWAKSIALIGPEYHAYHDELNKTWQLCSIAKANLMIVEGDVVIRPDVFDKFEECPNPVCAFTYWLGASYGYGLGCTRFRSAVMTGSNIDLIVKAGERVNDGIPLIGHFRRMDTRILDELRDRGYGDGPCVHEPPVKHLHHYAMPEPNSPEDEQWAIAKFRRENAKDNDMDNQMETLKNYIENCHNIEELEGLKRDVDSLRGTVEARIKTLQDTLKP